MLTPGVRWRVRIWYAGRGGNLSVPGADVNGLTLAGVGNGTVVEHCEVAYSEDDGFELFGGTVNMRWVAAVFCGDDAFDFDQAYSGKIQFALALLDSRGHRAGDPRAALDWGLASKQ